MSVRPMCPCPLCFKCRCARIGLDEIGCLNTKRCDGHPIAMRRDHAAERTEFIRAVDEAQQLAERAALAERASVVAFLREYAQNLFRELGPRQPDVPRVVACLNSVAEMIEDGLHIKGVADTSKSIATIDDAIAAAQTRLAELRLPEAMHVIVIVGQGDDYAATFPPHVSACDAANMCVSFAESHFDEHTKCRAKLP